MAAIPSHTNLPINTDAVLENVAAEIRKLDPDGTKTAQIIRYTFDQLYDGQRTGRYKWDQLYKTEKTHCGTLIEINLQRAFNFQDGIQLDYTIAGADVDCKYSQTNGGWMIPPEAHGHLCLLMWAEDKLSQWSMGLVRASDENLNTGKNRDHKATLNPKGRHSIVWIYENEPLPPNVLLQLDDDVVDNIMGQKSGQKRINELFRNARGRRIGRAVVATVAQQDDYMKRVRANGGARTTLKKEGIIILGQYESHGNYAKALGIAVPGPGESVSACVVPALPSDSNVTEINGRLWKISEDDVGVITAPDLPKPKRLKATSKRRA